jgi:hypothetical protein
MACCVEPDLQVNLTDDRHFRRWIDALTLEADRAEFGDPAFRKELSYWIGQGVFGAPPVMARLERAAVSHLNLSEPAARQDHAIVESAALLGLLSATGDSHLVHVRAGRVFVEGRGAPHAAAARGGRVGLDGSVISGRRRTDGITFLKGTAGARAEGRAYKKKGRVFCGRIAPPGLEPGLF